MPSVGDERSKIREDFIKRLFAVAISVGFAAPIAGSSWIKEGTLPDLTSDPQLPILLLGIYSIVLSWDGYLMSIVRKPLNDNKYGGIRFWIDIFLVFIYMIFLISSRGSSLWPIIMSTIFILYVIWDIFTIKEHPHQYVKYEENTHAYRITTIEIFELYSKSFRDEIYTNRGPITTLTWAIYFIILNYFYTNETQADVLFFVLMAAAGITFYRKDKSKKPTAAGEMAGWSMKYRFMAFLFLVMTIATYSNMGFIKNNITFLC